MAQIVDRESTEGMEEVLMEHVGARPPLRPWRPCGHALVRATASLVQLQSPYHYCSGDGSSVGWGSTAATSSCYLPDTTAPAAFFLGLGSSGVLNFGIHGSDNTNVNILDWISILIMYHFGILLLVSKECRRHLYSFIFTGYDSDLLLDLQSCLKFITEVRDLVTCVYYMLRKPVMVSLFVLLLSAIVFGALDLVFNDSFYTRRASENTFFHSYYDESHGRMLLAFNHAKHDEASVGKDSIISVDLRMTAANADGSGQDQKALVPWISDHNRDGSGKYYVTKKQNRPQKPHRSEHKTIKTGVVWRIVIASAIFVVLVVCFVAALLWYKCRNRAQQNQPRVQIELCIVKGPASLKYDEVAAATNNFSDQNKLGQGGFGPVYRGFLRNPERHVAVKLLSAGSSWQGQREFDAEVQVLTQVRHRNIVQLIGWCQSNEGGLLLVYELIAQGSLDKHLHNPVIILSWQQRYKIILDLGSALFYLHHCCEKCIVHGDIKPENVMLDASYNAKLGDFGTARLVEHGAEPRATEIVAGTRGYIDPEFVNNHLRCPEADMYSFGVTLLEIASGKRPASRQPNQASALLAWVSNLYDRHMVLVAADAKMNGEFDLLQMERVLVTGLWCAQQDPSQRPSIEQVMDVLRSDDATLPVLPATRDPQRVRILEEQAYGDLTGEGGSVDAGGASTCYLTSKDSAYLIAEK